MPEIHIRKDDIRTAKLVETPAPPLADGAARLRLDLFALTSNNVTYAALGEGMLGYWDFFPGPEGWGRCPVWGFATVTHSNAPGVAVGARFFGYYPMAETLDVAPTNVSAAGFFDGAPHRAAKAPVYNYYLNTAADASYDAGFEPEQTLFRPLYGTGWWAADCVMQGKPRSVVLSSASSKTALATAHQLRKLGGVELVGLTSAKNESYVRGTGLYDRTLTYDAVSSLAAPAPAVYVDFLGRKAVNAAVHTALGKDLARSIVIGVTDWSGVTGSLAPATDLPGPAPEFFFVPTYRAQRLKDAPALGEAMQRDLRAFYVGSRAFVTARRLAGAYAILESWRRLLAGEVPPNEGLVLSF